MVYKVRLTSTAVSALAALPKKAQRQIAGKIDSLSKNPRPPKSIKLKGQNRCKAKDILWRIRAGDYRIIYRINDAVVLVSVIKIAHRSRAYRQSS